MRNHIKKYLIKIKRWKRVAKLVADNSQAVNKEMQKLSMLKKS